MCSLCFQYWRDTHTFPKFPGIRERLKESRPTPSVMLRGSKKTSLEQNAKMKLEALEGKRWLSRMHITIVIQEQHCTTSQVGLFSVKELSRNLTIFAEVSRGEYPLQADFCSFC